MSGLTTEVDSADVNMVTRRLEELPNTDRKVYKLLGLSTRVQFNVHNNCLANVRRAIQERVLFVRDEQTNELRPPPAPRPGVFAERLADFQRSLRKRLPRAAPMSYEEFVDLYKGRKKQRYEAAVKSLYAEDISRRDSFSRNFLKAEKVQQKYYVEPSRPKDAVPRLISPRDPRYNVCVGRFLRVVEGPIYRAIGSVFGETTVTKGLNAEELGSLIERKWRDLMQPVAIGLDASRFDQHVSIDALKWEHSIYNGMFNDPELRMLLEWQEHNKCTAYAKDGKVTFTTHGTRLSGDMNTSLGNCLIMCAMVHAYLRHKNVKASLINNGDDCVVFMERKDMLNFQAGLEEWFVEMGFTMKVEPPVFILEHVEFCQMHPVFDGVRWIMVRNLQTSIAKDTTCILDIGTKGGFDKWRRAVADCGLSLTGGIPVMQEFYTCLGRGATSKGNIDQHPLMESGMVFWAKGLERQAVEPCAAARVSFWEAFGVTPDEQIVAESYYRAFTPVFAAPLNVDGYDHYMQICSPQSILCT